MFDRFITVSRFKFRLIIALFAVILFLTGIMASYGIYRKSVSIVVEEAMNEDNMIARSVAHLAERFIEDIIGQLEFLADLPEVQEGEDLDTSLSFRNSYGMLKPYVSSIGRLDASGAVVAGYEGDYSPLDSGYYKGFGDVIRSNIAEEDPVISNVRIGEKGGRRIFITCPIKRSDGSGRLSPDGLLVVELDPRNIGLLFSDYPLVDVDKDVNFVIVDREGQVIYASNNSDMEGRDILGNNGECVKCHYDNTKIAEIIRSGGGSVLVKENQNDGQIVSYVSMRGGSPGWLIGVYSDYNRVTDTVKSISWYSIMIVLVGVAILLPGTYLILVLVKKRDEAEERARYLEKEKKLLEKIREADREINEHNRELRLLNELAVEVNKTLKIEEVLRISLRKAVELTPFESGGIYLYDDGSRELHLEERLNIPAEIVDDIRTVPMGEGLTGNVAETQEPVFCESISMNSGSGFGKSGGGGYKSYAGVPLIHGKKLLGVMALVAKERIHPARRRQTRLKSIGTIIGMAVGNCILYQEVQNIAEEMSILYDVGRDLTSTIERPKLVRMVMDTLKGRLDYPACTLLLYDREDNCLHVEATSYDMNGDVRRTRFPLGEESVTAWVAWAKEARYVPDVSKERLYVKGREEAKSELALPLLFGDDLLGVLDFEKDEVNGFSEDEIRFLSLFTNQLSVALYNVNMFEETLRMNEELNKVSERKSEFVSLVSHELRTPLTAIKSSIDIILLRMQENLDEQVSYFLKIAKANVDRLSNMIDNILDISRIESGRMQFSLQALEVKEPAMKAINNVTPLAVQKGLKLENHITDDLPPIYADSGKVEQVFTNLIGNAIKFTPKGGLIQVEATTKNVDDLTPDQVEAVSNGHGEFVLVTVRDTGPGIPESEQKEIFKRFRRIEKGGGKGTGLGLAISKYLVDSHGGGIWVRSEPGKGSSFQFLLPVYKGEDENDGSLPVHTE